MKFDNFPDDFASEKGCEECTFKLTETINWENQKTNAINNFHFRKQETRSRYNYNKQSGYCQKGVASISLIIIYENLDSVGTDLPFLPGMCAVLNVSLMFSVIGFILEENLTDFVLCISHYEMISTAWRFDAHRKVPFCNQTPWRLSPAITVYVPRKLSRN